MSKEMDDDDPEVLAPVQDWEMETIRDPGGLVWTGPVVVLMIGAVVLAVIWLVTR